MQTSALCRLGYEICSTWKQKDCDNFLSFNQLWSSYQIFQNCQIIPQAKINFYIHISTIRGGYLESIIYFLSVIWPNIYFEKCPNFKLCTYLFPNNQDAKIDTKSKFCIPSYLIFAFSCWSRIDILWNLAIFNERNLSLTLIW